MCLSAILAFFGIGNKNDHILDGPDMARPVWSEFTISRCSETYDPIYTYTVKYDGRSDEGWLYIKTHDSKSVGKDIQLESKDVSAIFNLNLLWFPDEDALCGNFLGLTVTDSNGKTYYKHITKSDEAEMLAILVPYVDKLDVSEEDPFMLDGPSMEYSPKWVSFSVSQIDSSTLYSFWFIVDEDKMTVIGECQDQQGHTYVETEGIPISQDTIDDLHQLNLEQFPDEEPWPDDLEVPLDASKITLTLTLSDETVVNKNAGGTLVMDIYNLLLPYFKNK